ncbi:MAG: Dyp-type peroxidase [Candidatus Binataceae bacterium]
MRREETPERVNREDIQGIVASGYDHLDYSRFVFLEIKDPDATRKWLASIVPKITNALHPGDNKPGVSLNLAFSFKGLEKLVPDRLQEEEFPHEFIRGMNTDQANRILGDQDESDPKHWEYGAQDQPELHVLVMLYGTTDKKLQSLHDTVFGSREFSDGLRTIAQQDSVIRPDDETEPFGFRDGISQPPIQGLLGRRKQTEDPINTGEFVLGYQNELDLLTQIPSIDNWADPCGHLADHPAYPGKRRAFGLNGTYLVFRKLVQRVDEFKNYINNSAADPDERELIAAKMVGRWRSGAPLVLSPDSPGCEPRNDFLFMETDPDGVACPIGSHIRRANPRDSLDMPPSRSILIARHHRLIRRARKFSLPPKDLTKNNPKYEQGLFFIVLNADLRRQYEFVQQLWINDPSFNGLDKDRDPLVGDNSSGGKFTIQAKPINSHLVGLPQFVVMRGGGYFFVPGIRAVRFLANYEVEDNAWWNSVGNV